MSPLAFVFMLIAAIIILTVLTLKFKMHPVMVLFITATFCGIASGKSLVTPSVPSPAILVPRWAASAS